MTTINDLRSFIHKLKEDKRLLMNCQPESQIEANVQKLVVDILTKVIQDGESMVEGLFAMGKVNEHHRRSRIETARMRKRTKAIERRKWEGQN